MERNLGLDVLRGLLLVIMAINHIPNPLREYTIQPIGFVSAAEGFIFLSAFVFGSIIKKRLERNDLSGLNFLIRNRAKKIYLAHIMTLIFAFFVIGQFCHIEPVHNILGYYCDDPLSAMLGSLLLLYQPPLLDILPLYVILLLYTFTLVKLVIRHGWPPILLLSLAIWVLAQFGMKDHLARLMSHQTTTYLGAFDPFSWQLLWVLGLAWGYAHGHASTQRIEPPRLLGIASIALSLFFFCWRNPLIPFSINLGSFEWILDKWRLGPLRLLNFFSVMGVILWINRHLSPEILNSLKPLAHLGKNMLPLFCLHVCFSIVTISIVEHRQLSDWWCYLFLLLQLTLLYSVAQILGLFSNKPTSLLKPLAQRNP
ncbi:MAG: OpgC domain-containing protein [Candidatus Competibacter sp.]|nr:OpgC domain-containing protein [Candidatus Competibacter sp.]MDG4583310.1 OpgC domain-containing protein [Candidatus Competibacter sp.]